MMAELPTVTAVDGDFLNLVCIVSHNWSSTHFQDNMVVGTPHMSPFRHHVGKRPIGAMPTYGLSSDHNESFLVPCSLLLVPFNR